MSIRSHIKINTAILVSFVFLFRILFVNVCLFSAHQDKGAIKSHFSTLLKKRRRADVQTKTAFEIAAADDVCEENSGNEEETPKIHAPAILSWFHSVLKELDLVSSAERSFVPIKYTLCAKKYLTISVLRI